MFTHSIRPTLAAIVFTVMASTAIADDAVSELHNTTVNPHRGTVADTSDHRPHHRRYAHPRYYRSYRGYSRGAFRSGRHHRFYSPYGRRHSHYRAPRYRSYYY